MSIAKIEQLRKERIRKLESLEQELQRLKKDDTYSAKYKLEKETELKNSIKAVKNEYEPQINELIEQYENDRLQGFYNAEYKGLDEKQVTAELLKEIRNQKQTEYLIKLHEGKSQSGLRNELSAEAEKLVKINSPQAMAYINAMKMLGTVGAEPLEAQYKEQNMNDLQKAYQGDLNLIRKHKEDFKIETTEDPFKAAIMKYYQDNPNGQEE